MFFDLVGPFCQMCDAGGVKQLTCKPCSCFRSSGCGCRTWTGRKARWWRRSQPEPPRWWCPESPVGFQLWSVGETSLVSERLIKKHGVKAGGGCLKPHRNFTLVHWPDNEECLDGNFAQGRLWTTSPHSHWVIRPYSAETGSEEMMQWEHKTWVLRKNSKVFFTITSR